MTRPCSCLNCITPPYLLRRLLESRNREIREAALNTLLLTERMRGQRSMRTAQTRSAAPSDGRRSIFDCKNSTVLSSAVLVRTEDSGPAADDSANRAFDGLGQTRDFYGAVLQRNSIDGNGMRLDAYVHRGVRYNNAFWDGQQMVFGDGDGILFTDFTKSLDVISHELTHGVTEFTAGLEYHNQPGALNESMSDVFGSLVKQWSLKQSASEADWLIGPEVFTPGVEADALRSMKAPGTAYDSETLGKDPQPDHMSKYAKLPDTDEGDWGGVHINSGIPNRAFHLAATAIGGYAWEAPGHIWFESLKASNAMTQFQDFADTTYAKAGLLYGAGSFQQQAIVSAWDEVGIKISGIMVAEGRGKAKPQADSFATLAKQVESVASQMHAMAKEIAALKKKA